MRPATLLIFAKPPRIGISKTRLAKGLGAAEARRIATFTLARTLSAARASRLRTLVCVAPDRMVQGRASARIFGGFDLAPQGQGGLTERLTRAFEAASFGPVLFVGADAPDISAARLRDAASRLRRRDAVFGPARDGGFWLFGLHKGLRTVAPFDGVRWSGPHAMEDVWSRLPATSRIGLLDALIDIDEADDWTDWARRKG
jgi:rSAM/selenodomain-associated transferase 1